MNIRIEPARLPIRMSSLDPLDDIRAELAAIERAGLRRRMPTIDSAQANELVVDGRHVANFSSNNYLGLAGDPQLADVAQRAMQHQGFGAGASRLIAGNLAAHRMLEERLAAWLGAERALLFNTGYQANVGAVSALVGPEDLVFSDALNHASLIDGCRLSRAKTFIYRHCDPSHLDALLRTAPPARRRLVITDSLFSMDGDLAPLAQLRQIARAHRALLLVDDAHAIGVLARSGVGLAAQGTADLQMGTFGKALGGFGAFVAGASPLIELLLHRARSFVFTTALPVPVIAAAQAALDWLTSPAGAARRAQLSEHVTSVHARLRRLGFSLPEPSTHILSLRLRDGAPETALAASAALFERGLFVHPIRPPTVPAGTSRLRLTLMATHTDSQLEALCAALSALRSLFHVKQDSP